jgi:hypothetical protein
VLDDLLARLADRVGGARTDRLHEVILVLTGPGLGPDGNVESTAALNSMPQ